MSRRSAVEMVRITAWVSATEKAEYERIAREHHTSLNFVVRSVLRANLQRLSRVTTETNDTRPIQASG